MTEGQLDDMTNFYYKTEKVVMWREKQRQAMNNKYLNKKYRIYANDAF